MSLVISARILSSRRGVDPAAVLREVAAASGVATGILYLSLARDLSLRRLQYAGSPGGLLSAILFFLPLAAAEGWLALGGL